MRRAAETAVGGDAAAAADAAVGGYAAAAADAAVGGDAARGTDAAAGGDRPDPEARLQRALDLAYRYLGKRDRTEGEVRRHLAGKDVDDASVEGAVEALVTQGYVDDARYARTFAQDRRALDDWGRERIERRLLTLGIDADLVIEALSARDAAGEHAAAVALLRRRFAAVPATDRELERALGVLVRKGYDLDLACGAVRVFAGAPDAQDGA
jgi:regulatory protein